jgi:hypothetical protein
VKSGASCTKLKQTSVVANLRYTCVKSGKKLVWDKGVKINNPVPVANTSPVLTPEPSPNPTISPTPRSFVAPTSPTSFDDLESHLSGIIYNSWLKGSQKIYASNGKIDNIRFLIGPNTKLNKQDSNYQSAIDSVAKIFSGIPQAKNVYLIYYGKRDITWAQNEFEKYMDTNYGYGNRATAASDNCPPPNCNGGMAVHTSNFDGIILMGDNAGWTDPNSNPNVGYLGAVFAHEYTHTIQLFNMNPNWGNFPGWLTEGAANWASAVAVNSDSYDGYVEFRKSVYLGEQYGNPSKYSESYVTKFLNPNMTFEGTQDINSYLQSFPRWDAYSLGMMVCEILVALQGPESLIHLLQNINSGQTFTQAFQKEFGTSWEKAAPLIAKSISLQAQQQITK